MTYLPNAPAILSTPSLKMKPVHWELLGAQPLESYSIWKLLKKGVSRGSRCNLVSLQYLSSWASACNAPHICTTQQVTYTNKQSTPGCFFMSCSKPCKKSSPSCPALRGVDERHKWQALGTVAPSLRHQCRVSKFVNCALASLECEVCLHKKQLQCNNTECYTTYYNLWCTAVWGFYTSEKTTLSAPPHHPPAAPTTTPRRLSWHVAPQNCGAVRQPKHTSISLGLTPLKVQQHGPLRCPFRKNTISKRTIFGFHVNFLGVASAPSDVQFSCRVQHITLEETRWITKIHDYVSVGHRKPMRLFLSDAFICFLGLFRWNMTRISYI